MDNRTELIITDLDDTLTKSKTPMTPSMVATVTKLLRQGTSFAVISGGSFIQFKKQIIEPLGRSEPYWQHLFLLPTSGTAFYTWSEEEKNWVKIYDVGKLTAEEKNTIRTVFDIVKTKISFSLPETIYGEQLEDRGTQMTFSPLGQEAPLELKNEWDPKNTKRAELISLLIPMLSEFSVRSAGITSIDINHAGVDKAYGLNLFFKHKKYNKEKVVFFGDAFSPQGNDYPVTKTGIKTVAVKNPEELEEKLKSYINLLY